MRFTRYASSWLMLFLLFWTSSQSYRALFETNVPNKSRSLSSFSNDRCFLLVNEFLDYDPKGPNFKKIRKSFALLKAGNEIEPDHMRFIANSLQQTMQVMAKDAQELKDFSELPYKSLSRSGKKRLKHLKNKLGTLADVKDLDYFMRGFADNSYSKFPAESRLSLEDIEALALYTYQPFGKRVKSFAGNNFFSLSPFLFIPAASILLDGGLTASLIAATKLSIGIKGIDMALDSFLENTSKLVSKEKLVLLTAATTNIPELGAAIMAAAGGDRLEDSGSTPLGSNWVNLVLGVLAMGLALKSSAIRKQYIKQGQKFTPRIMWKTLKNIDDGAMKKYAGRASMFAISALTFQFVVRGFLQEGNPIPFAGWILANVVGIWRYFKKEASEKSAALLEQVARLKPDDIQLMRAQLKSNLQRSSGDLQEKFFKVTDELEAIKKADGKISPKKLQAAFKDVQKAISKDEVFQAEVVRALAKMDNDEIADLIKLVGIDTEVTEKMTKAEFAKTLAYIAAGMAAIAGFSVMLDSGVSDLPEAIPGMDKSAAGFIIMAFFSSIGELLSTKKFFQMGNATEGAQNIAHSNVINIMIAKLAMSISFIRNDFQLEEPLEEGAGSEPSKE